MSAMHIIPRDVPPRAQWLLEQAGIAPLLARLYAARGIESAQEVDSALSQLLPPQTLKGTHEAAALLADALTQKQHLCIVADYDCDGATACAVGLRGLSMLGFSHEQLSYLVPDRIADGYGLTPALAERVKAKGADILTTVDNGIASLAGVDRARQLGMRVLITDHHLPALIEGETVLPQADVIVNPNQPDCTFASKSIAGVGVMFYVLLALRAELRARDHFDVTTQPRLDALLDLVALGTVADVVKLDANNRRLVTQGLARIRKGYMQPGVAALFKASGRDATKANAQDIGFALAPRLNAAGRLADMTIGIECLLTDNAAQAQRLAEMLDAINHERKHIEADMLENATVQLERHIATVSTAVTTTGSTVISTTVSPTPNLQISSLENKAVLPAAIAIYDASFHEGVVGILASRIKDRFYRPAFVFAPSRADDQKGLLKGSGRSIAGFHLRDALDLVEKRHPGLLLRFGGHAMAAGCTIAADQFGTFKKELAQVAAQALDATTLARTLLTDGPLPPEYGTVQTAQLLQDAVWGSGFAPPVFSEPMQVLSQRIVGEKHLALKLRWQQQTVSAIWFGRSTPVPESAVFAYRLEMDEWQGVQKLRFVIEGMQDSA